MVEESGPLCIPNKSSINYYVLGAIDAIIWKDLVTTLFWIRHANVVVYCLWYCCCYGEARQLNTAAYYSLRGPSYMMISRIHSFYLPRSLLLLMI